MKERIRIFWIISVVVIALFATSVCAQPSTGDFSIGLETSGALSGSSGGSGDGWHEYPVERYFMWFQSTGFDPNRMGDIELSMTVSARDPALPVTYAIYYGWTKGTWTDSSAPPLPPVSGSESTYFTREFIRDLTDDTWFLPAEEFTFITADHVVEDFNPEWVYVSINGTNIEINGGMSVESIEWAVPDIGACCNTDTGDCFLTDDGTCFIGYIYLGDDTDCSDCQVQNFTRDFGGAPSSYPVTQAQNGARHSLQSGMFLGIGISAEGDGQPSTNANGDAWDDGVVFNTQILTGQSSTVTVTASTLGAINAWLDLNSDGDWADAGEHILVDEPVVQGQNTLTFYVPVGATAGQSFARFRYNRTGGIDYSGLASEGEVEDYSVTILSGSNPVPNPDPEPEPTPGTTVTPTNNQFASKWYQPIDLLGSSNFFAYGWNVVTRQDSIPLIADDWRNGNVLPVRGFRWWGAFDNWLLAEMPVNLPIGFQFGMWSHNPASEKPGTLIWQHTATDWVWAYTGQVQDAQGQIGGESVFEFTALLSQDKWFYPSATPNTVYWLSIVPIYPSNAVSPTPWGWMTRQTNGTLPAERVLSVFNPSQWPPVLGATYAAGSPITYPASTPWDAAFELLTAQPGGGSASGDSDLSAAIGDLNDDGVIDINDLYILLGFVLSP